MSDLVERLKWRRFPRDTKLSEDIRALGSTCDEAAARITELEAENARLREALQPFAEAAREFTFAIAPDGIDDGLTVEAQVCCRPERIAVLGTQHFSQAARASLGGSDE